MKKTSTAKQLAIFKARQRRGDINSIADMTRYSPSYVSKVINGDRSNAAITHAAYKLSRRRLTNEELAIDSDTLDFSNLSAFSPGHF